MRALSRRIELWAPDLDPSRGGVQAASRFFLDGLRGVTSNPVRVVTKVGEAHGKCPRLPNVGMKSAGRFPSWAKSAGFAAQLLLPNLLNPPALIVTTHVNFAPAAHVLKRLRGVPYVVAAHGIEVWGAIGAWRRRALRAADRVFAVSRYTAGRLTSDQGVSASRVSILPNTFASERFQPGPKSAALLARHGLAADQKIIFTLCRLAASERYKGYDLLLEALPAIRVRVPEAHYLIGGTGDDLPRLRALVRARGLEAHVTLAGFIPEAELPDYYRLCDVFAMPSTGEGFGIVFLEAMACGKPVLAGNRDGSTEPLADGRFGVLVDPTEIQEITAALVAILQRRHPHALMFQPDELRRQVVAEFGVEAFSAKLTSQLQGLLSAAAIPIRPVGQTFNS